MATLQTPAPTRVAPEAREVNIELIAAALYENFNFRRVDESAEWVARHCEWLDVPSGTMFLGPEGYLAFAQKWLDAFPDAWLEVTSVIGRGDRVVSELIARGTHGGPLIGPTEQIIEATGRHVEMRCSEVLEIENGQIVRARFYYDALTVLRQLGVVT